LEFKIVTIVKKYRFMQNMIGSLRSAMICCVLKLVELSTLAIGQEETVTTGRIMAMNVAE
jgi:hypothetical protein